MIRNVLIIATVAAAVLVFGTVLGSAQEPGTYFNPRAVNGQVYLAKTSPWRTITINSAPVQTPLGPVSAESYLHMWRAQEESARAWAALRQEEREQLRKDMQALPQGPSMVIRNIVRSSAESR